MPRIIYWSNSRPGGWEGGGSDLLRQLPPAQRQSFDGLSSQSGRLSQSRQSMRPFYPGRNPDEMMKTESFSGTDPARLSRIPDFTHSREWTSQQWIIKSNLGWSDVLVGVGGHGVTQAGGKISWVIVLNIILEGEGIRHSAVNWGIVCSSLSSPELAGPQSLSAEHYPPVFDCLPAADLHQVMFWLYHSITLCMQIKNSNLLNE